MKVTRQAIDPELRSAGAIARFLIRPSERQWRLARRMGRWLEGRDIAGLRGEQRRIPTMDRSRDVRLRIFRPLEPAAGPLAGVLYLHPGGYAVGNPELAAATIRTLVGARPCVVVAPDYCKSLEAPYPAALDDCYAALLWLRDHAGALGVRGDRFIVVGESAGGGLTAAVALRARDRGDVDIAFQMPLFPMIDDRMVTESCRDNDGPVWSEPHNRLGWRLYLGDLAGGDVPKYAAPARETDYAGLPPGATLVGALDPFRDETKQWVDNLRAAGVPFAFRLFEGCFHGFARLRPQARVSREADAFVREHFAGAVDRLAAGGSDGC